MASKSAGASDGSAGIGDALFELDHVEVEVDGAPLLRDVDLRIADGGVTVVLGPSGAGKTTLLRCCNRLEVPSRGTVRYRGQDLAVLDPLELRRKVGMVFQRPVLFAGTIRDNLLVADPEASESMLVDVSERAGLPVDLLDRPGTTLSGGEAQRACIARTLLTAPDVLLMDEPTSSLDPDNVASIEQLVTSYARDGMPVVWVTHDLAQARRLATATIVLVDGRVADDAEARRFLGALPDQETRPDQESGQ